MLCDFCGVIKERTIKVYYEEELIPERWCIDCIRGWQFDDDKDEIKYGLETIKRLDEDEDEEGVGV